MIGLLKKYNNMNGIKLIAITTTRVGVSKIYGNDDGTLTLLNRYAMCDGVGCPMYLYKAKLVDKSSPINNNAPYIYEYENIYSETNFTTSLYEINGAVKNKYVILRTNDTRYEEDLIYTEDELRFDVDFYNEEKREMISSLEDYDDEVEDRKTWLNTRIRNTVEQYEEWCDNMVRCFCDKHDLFHDDVKWVKNRIGGDCKIGKVTVSMCDIYYDLSNNHPPHMFREWYWKHSYNEYPEYKKFCKSARKWNIQNIV